jgi:hypothetical protein
MKAARLQLFEFTSKIKNKIQAIEFAEYLGTNKLYNF